MMNDRSKCQPPVRASSFRFLPSTSLPIHAVFEIDTETNPVPVCFSKQQLEDLAGDALKAAFKCDPEPSWADGSSFGE